MMTSQDAARGITGLLVHHASLPEHKTEMDILEERLCITQQQTGDTLGSVLTCHHPTPEVIAGK